MIVGVALATLLPMAPPGVPVRCAAPRAVLELGIDLSWLPGQQRAGASQAAQLRDLLLSGGGGAAESAQVDRLIDALAALRAPFSGDLGSGLWRAAYTRGEKPRWERNAKILPGVKNKAGQSYDVAAGTVVNYGELLGASVHFVAEGGFTRASSGNRCPQEFDVRIERGGVVLWGRPFVSDAISGPGFLRVLYAGDDVRIFESPTESPDKWEAAELIVVQVRDELFE